jgi:hypothetical protein
LQSQLAGLKAKGVGVAAISYDPVPTLTAFSNQRGITFPLLSDAGSATIRRYGILNTLAEVGTGPNKDDPAVQSDVKTYLSVAGIFPMLSGIAFPGTFMLDRDGKVTSRFFEDSYMERNTVSNLMMKIGNNDSPATAIKFSSAHLDLTAWSSDNAIAPGNRFSIVLDVRPHPGIHVYAPGATGYRPVALKLAAQPNLRALPVEYPASEIYFFQPLNERVPVFQRAFHVTEDVVLEGTPQAQAALRGKDSLTIVGSFDYQACDDKECFNPASVPLSWTLSLRPVVVERPKIQK